MRDKPLVTETVPEMSGGVDAKLGMYESDPRLERLLRAGIIRIAVPQDFAPFGSLDGGLRLRGLDIDVASFIARALTLRLTLVPVTSAQRIDYLASGGVDLIVSTLGKGLSREQMVAFSQPYAPFNNSVFGPASLQITGPSGLSGHIIGATEGALEERILTQTIPASTTLVRYPSNNALIQAYRDQAIPLIGTGDATARTISDYLPLGALNRPVLQYIMQRSACYVGVHREAPALLASINRILSDAKRDGTLDAINLKWLGQPLPSELRDATR